MTVEIKIEYLPKTERLTVVRDPEECSVDKDKKVRWWSDDFEDWRVVFGPDAPLYPTVASPDKDTLDLRGNRPEDYRHVKYVVVGLTKDGKLKHVDPELIVDK